MPVRAIFFDIGDTLIADDPMVDERLWLASRACGLSYSRDKIIPALRSLETFLLAHYVEGRTPEDPELIGPTIVHLFESLGLPRPDPDLIRRFAAAYSGTPFLRHLKPGALEMLAELRRRGFRLGIISDWETTLEAMLVEMTVMPLVDSVSVSAIVGVTKPDPALFRDGLTKLGVEAVDALHIGDFYELDVAGARAAGMSALLFDWRRRCPGGDCERVESFDELTAYCMALPSPL